MAEKTGERLDSFNRSFRLIVVTGKYHIKHDIFGIEVDKGNRRVIIEIDKINLKVKI